MHVEAPPASLKFPTGFAVYAPVPTHALCVRSACGGGRPRDSRRAHWYRHRGSRRCSGGGDRPRKGPARDLASVVAGQLKETSPDVDVLYNQCAPPAEGVSQLVSRFPSPRKVSISSSRDLPRRHSCLPGGAVIVGREVSSSDQRTRGARPPSGAIVELVGIRRR